MFEIADRVLRAYKGTDSEVVIPSNVTEISNAFNDDPNLKRVIIHSKVNSIWKSFNNCSALNQIEFCEDTENGLDISFSFSTCPSLETIAFPESTRSISGFRSCTLLESIVFREGLEHLYGFSDCPSLRQISLPEGTTRVDAFTGCLNLKSIELPSTIETIVSVANGNTALEQIKLPSNLKEIESRAFEYCTSLKQIVIPGQVGKIGSMAFKDCISLETVVFPPRKALISGSAFNGCQALKTLVLFKDGFPRLAGVDNVKRIILLGVNEKEKSIYEIEAKKWAQQRLKIKNANRIAIEFMDIDLSLPQEELDDELFEIFSPESIDSVDGINSVDDMEGHEFEGWCAKLLLANGFSEVEVTRGSGDQGVDVLATKDDIRYAIQCKCYASDLGNTPVQEVSAGKTFYHCHVGAVMTNRYFTPGAQELAQSNGVLLWDRDRLTKWMSNVTKDVPPMTVVGGVPAKPIRTIE